MRGSAEHLIGFPQRDARFYLSYDTKIAFYKQILHQNIAVSPLENATILWTSYDVICIVNQLVHYRLHNAWLYYTVRCDVI